MKKLFFLISLALTPVLLAQSDATQEKKETRWHEVGPGLFESTEPQVEAEYRIRGAAGLQLLLDGLRAQMEQLPDDLRRLQALRQIEAKLEAQKDRAAEKGLAVCAPLTRRVTGQYASYFSKIGCAGTEYDVDVFGTWDGQGCAVDIYVPGNLAQCGIQTSPSTVKSYRTPSGACVDCPFGSPLYSGECNSFSDAMPVYRGTECCEDNDCGGGEICRYGQCMECLVDSDCPSGQQCNAAKTCYTPCPPCAPGETCIGGSCVAPSCTPNLGCSGQACTLDSDCDNNGCPSSCSFGQCLCAW